MESQNWRIWETFRFPTLTPNLTWIEIGTSKEQPLGRSLTPPSTSSLRKQGKERYKKAAPVTCNRGPEAHDNPLWL